MLAVFQFALLSHVCAHKPNLVKTAMYGKNPAMSGSAGKEAARPAVPSAVRVDLSDGCE